MQRQDGTSGVTYRALLLSRFQTPGNSGYLSFVRNSCDLLRNALSGSNIDGSRYIITHNATVTSVAQVEAAIRNAFADSKEGDVNILITLSHGVLANGEYRWSLESRGRYVTGTQFALYLYRYAKGHTLWNAISCNSGNSLTSNSLIQRVRSVDAMLTGDQSLSVITSTDARSVSGYLNTVDTIAVEFFSQGFYNAVRAGGP